MEKPKIIKAKRKKRRKSSIWRQILQTDYELSKLNLYEARLHTQMLNDAFELEAKRRLKDYVR